MMRTMKWLGATISAMALLSTGCAVEGADGEDVGEAHEAQLDPGFKDYLIYTIRNPDDNSIWGQVLVTATAGGGFDANREYWYMTTNLSNSASAKFVGGASKSWSTPPSGLGTLSFVTNRTPSWSLELLAPRGTMLLHTNSSTGERIGIDWGMSNSGGTWTGSITWHHSSTGNILGEDTTTTLTSGTPASGTWYRYTTSPL